jgi:hypothetical protein
MTKEQMEQAVEEAREILARHEAGTFEPELEEEALTGHKNSVERILENREAWLQGQVIRDGTSKDVDSQEALAQFRSVEDADEMLTETEAIAYLRSMSSLNHEPLRAVEQEWLDRAFIRERMSKAVIALAAMLANDEEQGIHIEAYLQGPCRCEDRWKAKP